MADSGLLRASVLHRVRAQTTKGPENMLTLLVILLVVALVGGGVGHSRFGYAGWSPAGILILIVLVMALTGNLHR